MIYPRDFYIVFDWSEDAKLIVKILAPHLYEKQRMDTDKVSNNFYFWRKHGEIDWHSDYYPALPRENPIDVIEILKKEGYTVESFKAVFEGGESVPPRHPFIDALIENTECAARDEGIYFADSIRYDDKKTEWFGKMIEDYKKQSN